MPSTSRNVNLTLLKLQLSLPVLNIEHLESIIKNNDKNGLNQSLTLSNSNGQPVNINIDYLQRAIIKLKRIKKHKEWEKRRKQRIKQQKEDDKRSSIKEKTDIDKETTTISPKSTSSISFQLKNKLDHKIKKGNDIDIAKKNAEQSTRLKELTCKIEKLYQLRQLRRKKLEAKGHFFPEDDNEFFNKIKASIEKEDKEIRNDDNDNNKYKTEKEINNNNDDESIHLMNDDDQWQHLPLDQQAYRHWSQAWQSTTTLKNIRKHWDLYLINDHDLPRSSSTPFIYKNDNEFKIPPFWVNPSSPSHPTWASYIEQ